MRTHSSAISEAPPKGLGLARKDAVISKRSSVKLAASPTGPGISTGGPSIEEFGLVCPSFFLQFWWQATFLLWPQALHAIEKSVPSFLFRIPFLHKSGGATQHVHNLAFFTFLSPTWPLASSGQL